MAGAKPEPKRSVSIIPCFVFVELGILAGTVLLAYQLEFTDAFPVHERGFFCHDGAVAKPYPGPEAASRAPPRLVHALVGAVPTLAILVGEVAAFVRQPRWRRDEEETIMSGACCAFTPLLRRLVRFLGVFSFGLFATTIFAGAGQVVSGTQAPHFLAVCRPNLTALGCHLPGPRYVAAACSGDPVLVRAARRAFPCRDAALGAYASVYAAMYVTLVGPRGSRLARPALCLALLAPAFLLGVVRVAEHRNHWADILAGFLTGTAVAAFLVTCVVNNFGSRLAGRQGRELGPVGGEAPAMVSPCPHSPMEKLSVAQGVRPPLDEPDFSTLLTRGLERQLRIVPPGGAYPIPELGPSLSPEARLSLLLTPPDVLLAARSVTSQV
ncbi:phospholipid phosphatase-related protein type 2 [Alligator mississippiensis]|uniref:Lipid phosphate phosphatase-related protein type 2 isoform B n=1 Tax=Alligator mississippiensis TaxID=8496 RepID=A0A151P704_ALLMI|nr:phospholipid phosphatase-related protein type 2 [Alligator mississippiensis]KYO44851.1 lipid phosphate phosphatase-related protein type 2 isoform B [Alligator mississippiensis]